MYEANALVAVFISGFLLATGLMLYISQRLIRELETEIRSWRKEAIAAKHNADWWQNQYSKDAK